MAVKQPVAPVSPYRKDAEDSFTEWVSLNRNALMWGAVIVAIAVGGLWFYRRSQELKASRAEAAYYQARREAAAGNAQLAESDLRKTADRYAGTAGGTQARMYLAQLLFSERKFKEGIDQLKSAEQHLGRKDDFAASVHRLLANGYEEVGDFANAAAQYHAAGETTRFPEDKNQYKAYEARAFMSAGKRAQAMAIWQELAKDEASPFALEAKLRIGELEAVQAKV